jgi:hypothetical protein
MQMTSDLPMQKAINDSGRPGRLLLTGMALILALKLVLAFALDLYSDEIFYWQASTMPALAYSDLPFMAALLAGTGTALFGDTALGVRTLFLAMGTSIPLLVYWIARPLMPARQALEAAGLALCMPLCAFLGLLAVPDVPLLFFGLLMTGFLERATRLGTLPYWMATGTMAALGVSTHYRFAPLLVGAFVYMLAFRELRSYWRQPGIWIAAFILLIGLYPMLAFNLSNQLSGIDYHLLERHPWEFQAEGLLHVFKQAALVTPLLYVALAATLIHLLRAARAGDHRRGLFGTLALANLGIYMLLAPWSDNTRTSIHWPLSGYLPLLVFLPETLRRLHASCSGKYGAPAANRLLKTTLGMGFAGSLVALLGMGTQSVQDQLRPFLGEGVLSNKMAGWRPFTAYTSQLLQAEHFGPEDVLVTDNYYTGAQLELALGRNRAVYNIDEDKAIRDGRAVQYEIWQKNASGLQSAAGRNALFITEDSTLTVPDKLAVLERACDQFQRLDFLGQQILFGGEKSFSFYRAENIGANMPGTCPKPSLGWIDAPAEDSLISGSLTISGWVINEGRGVATVEVLVDGVPAGTATYGLPRPDVVEAMAAQDDPNAPLVGFELTIARQYLPAGRAELLVKTTSKSGEVQHFGRRMVNLK